MLCSLGKARQPGARAESWWSTASADRRRYIFSRGPYEGRERAEKRVDWCQEVEQSTGRRATYRGKSEYGDADDRNDSNAHS